MKIGIVGLGPLGAQVAERVLARGHSAVGWDKGGFPRSLMGTKLEDAGTLDGLSNALKGPRLLFLCTPGGTPADEAFLALRQHLSDGDMVVDCSPSHWRDSVRRYRSLRARGLRLLDAGLEAAEPSGPWSLMIGGDVDAFAAAAPLLDELADPGKAGYVGPPGAGHFARVVCESIQAAMRETLNEGLALLERSDYRYDLEPLLSLWQAGSGLRGAVLERKLGGLSGDQAAEAAPEPWLVEHALERGIPLPLLAAARFEALRRPSSGTPAPARAS